MIKNSIFWSIRTGILVTAMILVAVAFGCDSSESDTPEAGAGGAGAPSNGGGTVAGPYNAPTTQCEVVNPPMADPYCFNSVCPNAELPGLTDANKPMGDCCNTVDVKLREASMAPGTKYDLEFVFYINLPQSIPNVANPTIQTLLENGQKEGADIFLIRYKDVPRTEDMSGPVPVTVELGTGKLNCDGSYSFYGNGAAPEPVHGGPPNDPNRWAKKSIEMQYSGFNSEDLATHPPEDLMASVTQLTWAPRWWQTGINYEQPVKFLSFVQKVNPNNWSCFGSMDSGEKWSLDAQLTTFVPVAEAEQVTLQELGGQTQCGVFAKGPLQGNCDNPQSEWPTKPNGYCNAQHVCWVGVAEDPEAAAFWGEFFEGENNCGSAAHPCCDPTGTDAALQPCNAFYIRNASAIGAVEITDNDITDSSQAVSYKPLCTG